MKSAKVVARKRQRDREKNKPPKKKVFTEEEMDPKNWIKCPWRSAHDGMNTSIESKWKWNAQVPLEETRQYNMYDKTMRRNVSAANTLHCCVSPPPNTFKMTIKHTHKRLTSCFPLQKKCLVPLSDYGENFVDHVIYKPQTPANMIAIPNLPKWQAS